MEFRLLVLFLLLSFSCKNRTIPIIPGTSPNVSTPSPSPSVPQDEDVEPTPVVIPDSTETIEPAPAGTEGYVVSIKAEEKRGKWEGWGTSLAWWAHGIGQSSYEDLYADLLFTSKDVKFLAKTLPGLQFNIVRYNVGGGGQPDDIAFESKETPDIPSSTPSVHDGFEPYRDIDGFWKNFESTDPASASYDWNRDANQRSILQAAKERGVNTFEFFAQAPMWWMTAEDSAAGGELLSSAATFWMLYLANVAKYAKDNWGINVSSIAPFNEPSGGWWLFPFYQQGCNVSAEKQAEMFGYLKGHLIDRKLEGDIAISSSDENNPEHALATHEFMKSRATQVKGTSVTASELYSKVNVHGYNGLSPWRDNAAREKLRSSLGDKRLWVSEYSDADVTGMSLAQSIMEDLTFLRPTAWIYWQAVEPYSEWGLVNGNFHTMPEDPAVRGKPLQINTKYYVMAQFSRFVRPGQIILGSTDNNSLVAWDEKAKRMSLVTVNYAKAQKIEYDFSTLRNVNSKARVLVTNTDGSKLFKPYIANLNAKKLSFVAEPNSVYSIELSEAEF